MIPGVAWTVVKLRFESVPRSLLRIVMNDIKIIGWRQERESQQLSYTDVKLGRIGGGELSIQIISDWIKQNKEKVEALRPFEFLTIPGNAHNYITLESGGREVEVEVSEESTQKIMNGLNTILVT